MKTFVMMSGIPRSGSSVLGALLNQHPDIHASTTSPVADLITIVQDNWNNISASLINPPKEQKTNIIDGILEGAYKHIDKPVIVDKNRLWPRIGAHLDYKFKVIATVRDIPEVLASFILLIEKTPGVTYVDKDLQDLNLPINTKNRCRILWEKYINHPYTSLRMGFNSNNIEFCILDYDDIVHDSQNTMDTVCEFIGIDTHRVDINNIQSMDENDAYHGGLKDLHLVRSKMERSSPLAEQVIGKDLVRLYTDMKLNFWNKGL